LQQRWHVRPGDHQVGEIGNWQNEACNVRNERIDEQIWPRNCTGFREARSHSDGGAISERRQAIPFNFQMALTACSPALFSGERAMFNVSGSLVRALLQGDHQSLMDRVNHAPCTQPINR